MRASQHRQAPVQTDRELLIEICTRLERIEQQLIARRKGRPADRWDDALITTIATSTQGRYFTARELFTHAQVDPLLTCALADACVENPKQLGKLLRRLEGHRVAGICIECADPDHRTGIVWRARVSRV